MSRPHEPPVREPWRGRAPVPPRPPTPPRGFRDPPPDGPPPYRPSRWGRWVVAAALVVVAALLVMAGLGLARLPGEHTPSPAAATTAAATTPTTPVEPGLRQPARDGGFEFIVASLTCGKATVGSTLLHRTAQGKFCEVALTVRNIGDQARVFDGHFQKAHDATGARYSDDLLAELIVNSGNQTFLKEINPGNQVRGILVFDIPRGATISTLELHDSPLSGGVTVAVR